MLKLTPDAKLKLTRSLVESLSQLSEKEIERLWLDEAERRDFDMESGKTPGIAGDEVFRRIRARYK